MGSPGRVGRSLAASDAPGVELSPPQSTGDLWQPPLVHVSTSDPVLIRQPGERRWSTTCRASIRADVSRCNSCVGGGHPLELQLDLTGTVLDARRRRALAAMALAATAVAAMGRAP